MWNQFFYCEVEHGLFTPEECQTIIELGVGLPKHNSILHRHDGLQIRDSDLRWLYANQGFEWVFDRVNAAIERYNHNYNYEIVPIQSGQLTFYGLNQEYNFHVDIGPGEMSLRKISCSVELCNPASYEGGGLVVGQDKIILNQGDMALFPSMMLHRAPPVTWGQRVSLVCWILGNQPLR